MRRWILGALVLAVVALGGILLTPPVHALLVDWGWLAPEKFPKVIRRLVLIPVLIALFAMLRPWRDGGPRSYGLTGPHARPRVGLSAWAVTTLLVLGLFAWQFAEGWLRWREDIPWERVLPRTVRWIFTGVLLGVIEEWFFRGWLQRRFRRRWSWGVAAVWVAAIFAALHAFKPTNLNAPVSHDVAGAFEAIGMWLSHLANFEAFGPTFLGLFLLSLLLAALYRRTRTLWAPIGVHAAGIFWLKIDESFTVRWPPRTWAGTKALYDGWPVWGILLLVALWALRRGRNSPDGAYDGL